MIDTPQIIQTTEQTTAIIPLVVSSSEIRKHMGPGIQELMSTVAAQGVQPAGPWFTRHNRKPAENFDFEISVPVQSPVKAIGRVKPSVLPARKVARKSYCGGYEGLGAGWGEFHAWLSAQGLKTTPDFWESYLIGPEIGPDGSKYQTELNAPLV